MILKIIVFICLVGFMAYLIYKNAILEDRVNQMLLELKIKDAHIKQQQEKINNALNEAEDLQKELEAIYGKSRPHPEDKRSEILMLRARGLTLKEIWKQVWLAQSTISKYLRIWDSEIRWSEKYPRPVMPKNTNLVK